ncbi:MAG: hypothetical protein A2X28_08600 [Elusimicrobia bacterium GWA2_56_46]|nr:MAG: hypothetical protein A2X28_08600 [Elusimicrobia bacterium GWA2_56_46]OGR55195.1 MAG: hypothetical protein A2X39_01505 [Elusimicrobia bacterium GWC2_56_31]HBB66283.1 hypothetical protein [Elusimicrobiota bacterium]HBW23731.1 hypothetical protein [Elusimicrobiota bacterium]
MSAMKKKVLVVDDDEGILSLLCATLERVGYETVGVDLASTALKKLSEENFPVVLSDIMLPNMDGLQLLSKIKELSPDTQVVMITANVNMDTAIASLKRGAFGYLKKPLEPEEMISQINNAFDRASLIEENKRLVAELKTAKEYAEQIIKDLTYTVIGLDVEGRIKKINHAVETLLGYTEEEVLGKPITSIFTEEFKTLKWPELLKENRVSGYPVSFRAKDGREVRTLFTGSVMKNSAGKLIGFIGTARSKA